MEFKEQKAIYLQIAEHLCDEILSGKYHQGDKLPSVRDLAMEAEVNVNTVARSLEWLQQKGVAITRRGQGNFVTEGGIEAVETLRREEFFSEQLPDLFRVMRALGVGHRRSGGALAGADAALQLTCMQQARASAGCRGPTASMLRAPACRYRPDTL